MFKNSYGKIQNIGHMDFHIREEDFLKVKLRRVEKSLRKQTFWFDDNLIDKVAQIFPKGKT